MHTSTILGSLLHTRPLTRSSPFLAICALVTALSRDYYAQGELVYTNRTKATRPKRRKTTPILTLSGAHVRNDNKLYTAQAQVLDTTINCTGISLHAEWSST